MSVADHFNLPNHTIEGDFRVCVLKSISVGASTEVMRKEEDDIIERLETIEHGLNLRRAKKK